MTYSRRLIILVLVAPALFVSTASSELFKWTDADGRTFYSDKPPAGGKAKLVVYRDSKPTSTKASIEPGIAEVKEDNKPVKAKKIVMYSAAWCGVCKKAKAYLDANGISYKEYDIENSLKGRNDYKRLKGAGVPIIMIDKERMDGFSQGRFEKMYES